MWDVISTNWEASTTSAGLRNAIFLNLREWHSLNFKQFLVCFFALSIRYSSRHNTSPVFNTNTTQGKNFYWHEHYLHSGHSNQLSYLDNLCMVAALSKRMKLSRAQVLSTANNACCCPMVQKKQGTAGWEFIRATLSTIKFKNVHVLVHSAIHVIQTYLITRPYSQTLYLHCLFHLN